jgi:hypothetical protein
MNFGERQRSHDCNHLLHPHHRSSSRVVNGLDIWLTHLVVAGPVLPLVPSQRSAEWFLHASRRTFSALVSAYF